MEKKRRKRRMIDGHAEKQPNDRKTTHGNGKTARDRETAASQLDSGHRSYVSSKGRANAPSSFSTVEDGEGAQ